MTIGGALKDLRILKLIIAVAAILLLAGPLSISQEKGVSVEAEEFDFANGLFSRGMYDMAIEGYKDFLKKHPQSRYSHLANYRIAECYFLDGKYDEALNRLGIFLKRSPPEDLAREAVLRKGQIYYLKGDYENSEKILSDLAGKADDGNTAEAAKYYLAGINFKRGEYTTSRKMLEELLSASGDGEYAAFAYMNLGDIYTELKEYRKAAEAYGKAGEAAADKDLAVQADFRAGSSYYKAGDYAKAQVFYRKATETTGGSEALDHAALGLLSTLYKNKEYDRVIEGAKDLISRIGDKDIKSQAMFILGSSYFQKDDFPEAGKIYKEAAAEYPDTQFGLKSKLNEGWALYRQGKFEECLSSIGSYGKMTQDSLDEALFVKARVLSDLGRTEEALAVYKEISEKFGASAFHKEALYETGWLYSGAGQGEKAVQYFNAFAEKYPQDKRSATVIVKGAQENLKLKRYKDAEKGYDLFLSKFGSSPLKENVLYQLGRTYFEQGEYDKAIETYKKFAQEFPDSQAKESAVFWMGMGYQKKEQWDKAISAYSGLIADVKGEFYGRAMESTGYCYFQKGDAAKAADEYYVLMTQMSDFKLPEGVYRWVADLYLNGGDSKKSLEVLQILVEKYPEAGKSGEVSYAFGANYARLGNTKEAIKYFQEAIDAGAGSPFLERSYLGLGRAYLATGDDQKAMRFLEQALKEHKDNRTGALTRFEIGNVNYKIMNFDEAAKQYMMVAILYEDEDLCSKALFQAGVSFEKAGVKKKSIEVFKELIERYPDNALSKKAAGEIRRIENETG